MANSDGRLVKRRLPVGAAISRDKNSHDRRRQRMANSDGRLVKRRLPVGAAISRDKNSHDRRRQRMANSDGRRANSRGERRFALNSHDKNGSQWRLVKRKLTVGVAISHDGGRQPRQKEAATTKTAGRSEGRQIGRSEGGKRLADGRFGVVGAKSCHLEQGVAPSLQGDRFGEDAADAIGG
jgi:hypothetical protein